MSHFVRCSFLIFTVFVAIVSCSDTQSNDDIRRFYFPLKELNDGLVYAYEPEGTLNLGAGYWFNRSFISDTSARLVTTHYNDELLPVQINTELLASNGMLLESLRILELDSTGRNVSIDAEIGDRNVFPFIPLSPTSIYETRIQFESILEANTRYFRLKQRQFLGDTTFIFAGEEIPAIKVSIKEVIDQENDGTFTQEVTGMEIYAENMGLVYYEKDFGEGLNMQYRLVDTFPMDTLEQRFERMLKQE